MYLFIGSLTGWKHYLKLLDFQRGKLVQEEYLPDQPKKQAALEKVMRWSKKFSVISQYLHTMIFKIHNPYDTNFMVYVFKTWSSPRRPLFLHALSFECTTKFFIFSLFSNLNIALHNLVIELCSALKNSIF